MLLQLFPRADACKTNAYLVKQILTSLLSFALVTVLAGCAGISTSTNQTQSNNSVSKIVVSPNTATVSSGGQQLFTATLSATTAGTSSITWKASAGTISQSGMFTAPSVTSSTTVTVTASSSTDTSVVASAQVSVVPPGQVTISVFPSDIALYSAQTYLFTVTITATTNTAVVWQTTAGTISSSGLFTAPSVASNTVVTLTATSSADSAAVASVRVVVVPEPNVAISLLPSDIALYSGGSWQFTATVTPTTNTAVIWQTTAGTISPGGLFTAPALTTTTNSRVTVTAISVANMSAIATAQVTVVSNDNLGIAANTLPTGTAGAAYSATLAATGGTAPYTWQITSGSLPQGLALNNTSGIISGTTSLTGSFSFTASVTDATSANASAPLNLTVNPVTTTGTFDGPAELPRVYVMSALADTPAPGSVIAVAQGGDFQSALNGAQCGDTITLQAGAVFTGSFTFPAQTCDDAHWIIIRTSAADSSLPPENARITPCYAGISSLPGRPAFNCTSTANVMAKIEYAGASSGPITFANGASHYRFIGLEITRASGTGIVYDLVFNQGNAANHIIFDRSWIHGTAQDETQRGVMLAGTTYAAIVDSYFSDFHCVSTTGACLDSQDIAGGLGSLVMGPYKIVDNFLESAAESIIFGGDVATTTPTDIEIRRNHMFKPMIWMQGQPGFVGGVDGNPFIVKNLLELKNAQRVLFEANILENAWGGFSQEGFGILLTPKNQAVGTGNGCPSCAVTDITIRYCTISHVGGGMQIGNGPSDNGGTALAGERYSIHDVTIDDIDATKYNGYGDFAQVSMGAGAPVLQYVTINHVTTFQPNVMLNLGDDITVNPPMNNFVFTNNIVNGGTNATKTTGGGKADCAYYPQPLTSLGACFTPYTFTNNAIIATPAVDPISDYPSGNFFPASATAVDFVSYNGGNGGDYHLQSTSPYKNAGTDGLDLGADIDTIQADIAGVY